MAEEDGEGNAATDVMRALAAGEHVFVPGFSWLFVLSRVAKRKTFGKAFREQFFDE